MTATPRQLVVLRGVLAGKSMREIAVDLGPSAQSMRHDHGDPDRPVSPNAVNDHLSALHRKGLIKREKGFSKSIPWQVTDEGLAELGLRRCPACDGCGHVPGSKALEIRTATEVVFVPARRASR